MKLRKSKLYPSDAPTCKSGSTSRLLGISFKSASKIVCEVGAAFSQNPFNRFFKLRIHNLCCCVRQTSEDFAPWKFQKYKSCFFGSLSQTALWVSSIKKGHVTIFYLELLGKYPCWEMGGVPFQSVNPFSQRTLSKYKIHKVVFDGNVTKDNNWGWRSATVISCLLFSTFWGKHKFWFTSRWKLIRQPWVSVGFSTAANTRSGRVMKNSARLVSSPSSNFFPRLQRTTGRCSASGRTRSGGRRRLVSSRWEKSFDSFADLSLQIVPTGKPSPLTGCQIVNKTLTSLKVQCQEGKPGPKEEMFTFFHENISKALTAAFPPTSCLSSTTLRRWSSSPKWPTKCQYLRCHWNCQQYWSSWSKLIVISSKVSHIDPGVPIKLLLYAENAKGTSDPAVIDDALSSQHKHYVEGGEMMTGWLWRWWQDHCGDDDRLTVEMMTQ